MTWVAMAQCSNIAMGLRLVPRLSRSCRPRGLNPLLHVCAVVLIGFMAMLVETMLFDRVGMHIAVVVGSMLIVGLCR